MGGELIPEKSFCYLMSHHSNTKAMNSDLRMTM